MQASANTHMGGLGGRTRSNIGPTRHLCGVSYPVFCASSSAFRVCCVFLLSPARDIFCFLAHERPTHVTPDAQLKTGQNPAFDSRLSRLLFFSVTTFAPSSRTPTWGPASEISSPKPTWARLAEPRPVKLATSKAFAGANKPNTRVSGYLNSRAPKKAVDLIQKTNGSRLIY